MLLSTSTALLSDFVFINWGGIKPLLGQKYCHVYSNELSRVRLDHCAYICLRVVVKSGVWKVILKD